MDVISEHMQQPKYGNKISVVYIGDSRFTGTADSAKFLVLLKLSSFIIERNAKFQLVISKMKSFFPVIQVYGSEFSQEPIFLRLSVTKKVTLLLIIG